MTFPQLSSGAVAQWPIGKKLRLRGVAEESAGGRRETRMDDGEQWCEWSLRYHAVTTAERDVLDGFFALVEGRLREFRFLDPLGNLLRWSEDWTQDRWTREPQMQATASDEKTTLVNAGQAAQSAWQVVAAPASYLYTFGVRLRASESGEVAVFLSDGSQRQQTRAVVGPEWSVVLVSGRLDSTAEQVRAGLELPAGASVDVAWSQLAAQPGLGAYQATREQSGVFARTRFAQDEIVWTSLGADWHSTTLKLSGWAG